MTQISAPPDILSLLSLASVLLFPEDIMDILTSRPLHLLLSLLGVHLPRGTPHPVLLPSLGAPPTGCSSPLGAPPQKCFLLNRFTCISFAFCSFTF